MFYGVITILDDQINNSKICFIRWVKNLIINNLYICTKTVLL